MSDVRAASSNYGSFGSFVVVVAYNIHSAVFGRNFLSRCALKDVAQPPHYCGASARPRVHTDFSRILREGRIHAAVRGDSIVYSSRVWRAARGDTVFRRTGDKGFLG